MDARSAGEENRGKGENRGRWRRNAGKGEEGKGVGFFYKEEAGVGSAGFIKTQKPALGVPAIDGFIKCRNRRWECRLLIFFKMQKPALVVSVIEIF